MAYKRIDSQFLDELLGSRLTWRVLRIMVMHPFLGFHLTDLASRLETSNKSVLRIIRKLIDKGLVLGRVGSHEKYRINPDIRMTRKIWSIFMSERIQRIPEAIKVSIFPFFEQVKDRTDAFIICEYPSYEGMRIFKDRISIAIASDTLSSKDTAPLSDRLDIHIFPKGEFFDRSNPVIQHAVLSGVVLRGEDFIFSILKSMGSFPHSYISEKIRTYDKVLRQNGIPDEELTRRQLEIIDNNIYIFEAQFDIRDNRDEQKPLLERIDLLKSVVTTNNNGKYL